MSVSMNCFTHLKRISEIAPMVLVISSPFSMVHYCIGGALRERLSLVPICGKIIGLCAVAGVGILSLVEVVVLRLLLPRLRLNLMSFELNAPSLIRVPIRRVVVIVPFVLVQEN